MKKFLAIVLALTLVLGLCACGGNSGNEGGTGVLDPNSDKDWNAYLKELDDLGLPVWLELAQTTYDKQK